MRIEALSEEAGLAAVTAGDVDALLLLEEDRLVFHDTVDPQFAAIADAAVGVVRRQLPPAPEITPATIEQAEEDASDGEALVAIAGSVPLLTCLAVYGQRVVSGVVEERSNRVAERILATARPRDLLAGKVIGIGVLGLGQIALVAVLLLAAVLAVIRFAGHVYALGLLHSGARLSPRAAWRSGRGPGA